MYARCFMFLAFLFCMNQAGAQRTDKKLQGEILKAIEGYHGSIGVYIKDLDHNKIVSINADTIFPTASIVKIPILIGIMDQLNRGALTYHQELTYRDSLLYPGVDILGSFKDTEKIELSKVMMLSLSMSDNTASLWLQSLAGGGQRINQLLDSMGYRFTRVNSKTPGREQIRKIYGWGQTTPLEMGTIMEQIAKGNIISKEVSARMLRLLGRNYWDEEALSQVPTDVFVASKNGAVDESRSETMFVKGRKAQYIFCVFTKNNTDQRWTTDNEAWELTRKLSRLVWEHESK